VLTFGSGKRAKHVEISHGEIKLGFKRGSCREGDAYSVAVSFKNACVAGIFNQARYLIAHFEYTRFG
jgi:hypothetical protein